jgi:hypothetical protein
MCEHVIKLIAVNPILGQGNGVSQIWFMPPFFVNFFILSFNKFLECGKILF